jgi:sensor histidine kinase YesM
MAMSVKSLSRLELRSIALLWIVICDGLLVLTLLESGVLPEPALQLALLCFVSALPFFYLLDISQDVLSGVFSKLSSRLLILLFCVLLIFSLLCFIGLYVFDLKEIQDHFTLLGFVIFTQGMMVSVLSWTWTLVKGLKRDRAYRQSIEGSLREAELHHLRRQLQPHFLFNSLNSIKALVLKDTRAAGSMLENLSEFLRSSLNQDENRPVPLEEELRLLELYLSIEKVRFADRLQVHYAITDEARACFLPALVLQPAMENAVKFGLNSGEEKVELHVKAFCREGGLQLELQNPCDEVSRVSAKGKGFGLDLLRRRLHLLYKRSDLLHIKQEQGIFITRIFIPQ